VPEAAERTTSAPAADQVAEHIRSFADLVIDPMVGGQLTIRMKTPAVERHMGVSECTAEPALWDPASCQLVYRAAPVSYIPS
jgi:hypothetical protein